MNNIFEQTIVAMYGDAGRKWLASLPQVISKLSQMWHITDLQPVTNLSYNYVMTGVSNDIPVILKIGNCITFGDSGIAREDEALNALSGPCVKVLERDDARGALLLECLIPGNMLKEHFPHNDHAGVLITSSIIKAFNRDQTPPKLLQPVADIMTTLEKEFSCIHRHVQKAQIIGASLLASTSQNVLLHGDLHQENILLHGNTWRVIDPKGLVGDPAYECCSYIRNPFPEILAYPDILMLIKKRIHTFSALLELGENRIIQWTYVQAVLAACWAAEDKLDTSMFIKLCDLLEQIL